MKQNIVITIDELKEIMGKHFKIKAEQITYVGWTGIWGLGEFRIEYGEDEKK